MSANNNPFMSLDTISIEDAKSITKTYQDEKHAVKAFSIFFEDLVGLVDLYKSKNAEMESEDDAFTGVRIYFGVKETGHECIVLVPVQGYSGKDAPGHDNLGIVDDKGVQIETYCYDFSHPCPSTCDVSSQLNHEKAKEKLVRNY